MNTTAFTHLAEFVGRKISRNRIGRDMTQAYLAKLAGISERRLRQYEYGLGVPSLDVLFDIAKALDLHPASLIPETKSDCFPIK